MKTLPEHMAFYGTYHQDARNRLTHFIGVPAIIFAILIPMSLVRADIGGVTISVAEAFWAVMAVYYIALDRALGAVLSLVLLPVLWAGDAVARQGAGLAWPVFGAAFVLGWAVQLLGHRFEGNRPALLDNLFQLLVSPIFLAAEAAFALGLRPDLRRDVGRRIRDRDFPGAKRV